MTFTSSAVQFEFFSPTAAFLPRTFNTSIILKLDDDNILIWK